MKKNQISGTPAAIQQAVAENITTWHSLQKRGSAEGEVIAEYLKRPAFFYFAQKFIANPTAFNLGFAHRDLCDAGGRITLPAEAYAQLEKIAQQAQENSEELREWLHTIRVTRLSAARVWFAFCNDAQAVADVFGTPLIRQEIYDTLLWKPLTFSARSGKSAHVFTLHELSPYRYAVQQTANSPFLQYGDNVRLHVFMQPDGWAVKRLGHIALLSQGQPNPLHALRRALSALERAARPAPKRPRKKKTA